MILKAKREIWQQIECSPGKIKEIFGSGEKGGWERKQRSEETEPGNLEAEVSTGSQVSDPQSIGRCPCLSEWADPFLPVEGWKPFAEEIGIEGG